MRKGVITTTYGERMVDHITSAMYKAKLFKTDGFYPITEEATGKEVGAFICICGNGLVVRFLEYVTDIRGKNTKKVWIDY